MKFMPLGWIFEKGILSSGMFLKIIMSISHYENSKKLLSPVKLTVYYFEMTMIITLLCTQPFTPDIAPSAIIPGNEKNIIYFSQRVSSLLPLSPLTFPGDERLG